MTRLIVIGGDAAGASAASVAKRRRPDLDVVMVERGDYTSYAACGLPYWISGDVESSEKLISRDPAAHRSNGLDVRMHTGPWSSTRWPAPSVCGPRSSPTMRPPPSSTSTTWSSPPAPRPSARPSPARTHPTWRSSTPSATRRRSSTSWSPPMVTPAAAGSRRRRRLHRT